MRGLIERCESGGCDTSVLLPAIARFYQHHLSGPRCRDTFEEENHKLKREEALGQLNGHLRKAGLDKLLVSEPEDKKASIEPGPKRSDFFDQDAEYRKFMRQIQARNQVHAERTDADDQITDRADAVSAWRAQVQSEMERSPNPVIMMYARLNRAVK